MRRFALLMALVGLLMILGFALGGAGEAGSQLVVVPALGESVGFLAHPMVPGLGLLAIVVAVSLGLYESLLDQRADYEQRRREESEEESDESGEASRESLLPPSYPLAELSLLAVSGLAALFASLTLLGTSHGWEEKSLGVLFASAVLEVGLALVIGLRVAFKSQKAKGLYGVGMVLTVGSLALCSALMVFLGEL